MNRRVIGSIASVLMLLTALCGCNGKRTEETDGTLSIDTSVGTTETENPLETESAADEGVSEDQALAAIKNYCYEISPDLENIENEGEYPVYWESLSSDDGEIVVLFRSYTGAEKKFHIDRSSGDTYVMEFVPGVTEAEQRTDESFNIKDYLSED